MKAKKVVQLALVALVLFYLVTRPTQAADEVRILLSWLKQAAEAVIVFLRSLFA